MSVDECGRRRENPTAVRDKLRGTYRNKAPVKFSTTLGRRERATSSDAPAICCRLAHGLPFVESSDTVHEDLRSERTRSLQFIVNL
jgi:hypothetical protein